MDRLQWLTEISTAIADGEPVDWAAVDGRALTPHDRRLVDRFRVLERVVRSQAMAVSVPSDSDESSSSGDADRADDLKTWGALTQLEKIGSGAFGDVYRAYDPQLDRTVALKLLHPSEHDVEAVESRVIEEGRLLARVHHPNVVTVYGAERIDGRVGLWMEFIEGRTLEDEVVEDGPLDTEDILNIGLDLCGALAAVHRAGVLHLDLKAQNVMRMPTGRIVLTDFGVAKDILISSPDERFELAGTPLYMAPELLEGQAPSIRSDVYSLGVLLFHLASGAFPLRARTLRTLRSAHIAKARVNLGDLRPDLPAGIATVIDRATERDPSKRYQTTAQLERAMRNLLSIRAFASRKWWMLGAALLGAGAAFLGSFLVQPQFRSQATLLFSPARISIIAGATPGQMPTTDEWLMMKAVVLSRTRLERVITDENLYANERQRGTPMQDVVERMRADVDFGLPVGNTLEISFTDSDPRSAMKVTERLAGVMIDEGLSNRARLADGTWEFLNTEIDQAKNRLTVCEAAIAAEAGGGASARSRIGIAQIECEATREGLKALLTRRQEAAIQANIERRQVGEQFTLLDRARLPVRPISPDRVRYSIWGLLAGLAVGVALSLPSSLRALRPAGDPAVAT